jgi:hypothetical protein
LCNSTTTSIKPTPNCVFTSVAEGSPKSRGSLLAVARAEVFQPA